MPWLSRVNFVSSDTLSFTDVNNLGNDIRAWGDNVNGGGYTLSNVTISASSGFIPLVIGGTGTTSTLILRATSGAGATGADIVFQTGNNGATEALRISNSGSSNFGKVFTSGVQTTGNATFSYGDVVNFGASINGASITWDAQTNAGNASVMARLRPRWLAFSRYALDVFVGDWNNAYNPGSAVATFESTGNLKIGGTADRATTAGTNQVVIFNGTAPVGTLANGASFYATAGEMRVMDASGNATLLSPHDSATNEWIYDSTHTPTGKRLRIRVEALMRFVDEHFGLGLVSEDTVA